jgi:starch phosphorylase
LRQLPGEVGGYIFSATVSSSRPASDYTARIVPHCDGLAVPLEAGWILWQK